MNKKIQFLAYGLQLKDISGYLEIELLILILEYYQLKMKNTQESYYVELEPLSLEKKVKVLFMVQVKRHQKQINIHYGQEIVWLLVCVGKIKKYLEIIIIQKLLLMYITG